MILTTLVITRVLMYIRTYFQLGATQNSTFFFLLNCEVLPLSSGHSASSLFQISAPGCAFQWEEIDLGQSRNAAPGSLLFSFLKSVFSQRSFFLEHAVSERSRSDFRAICDVMEPSAPQLIAPKARPLESAQIWNPDAIRINLIESITFQSTYLLFYYSYHSFIKLID